MKKKKIVVSGDDLATPQVLKFNKYLRRHSKVLGIKKPKRRLSKRNAILHKLQPFKRERTLHPSEIKPLLVIFSPRDIKEVIDGYDKIDFVDKLWIRYILDKEAQQICKDYVASHKEYTHIILSSDDIVISPLMLKILLQDLLEYDFPSLAGCCNACDMYRRPQGVTECQWCTGKKKHPYINVSRKKTVNWKEPWHIGCPKTKFFLWETEKWRKKNPNIVQMWFQGMALGILRRDMFDKQYALNPLLGPDGKTPFAYSYDFSFAVEAHKRKILQFVDLRVKAKHIGTHHRKLYIGKKEPEVYSQSAVRKLEDVIFPFKPANILICTPFNNESHSIDQYVESLLKVDYPKELIDLVWLENDSVDDTWARMKKHAKTIKKAGYNSLLMVKKDFGLKHFGKIKVEDFGYKISAGKNMVVDFDDILCRGARLASIYHYFFSLLTEQHDYMLIYMADVVTPPNIIKRYLEVVQDYPDAGWIGGIHHKRYPMHFRDVTGLANIGGLAGPLMFEKNRWRYMSDEEIVNKQLKGEVVFECGMTGHVWLMPSEIILKGVKSAASTCEIVAPIIYGLWGMGYKVYCASDIYLEHISLDGKIWRHSIYEEMLRKKRPNVPIQPKIIFHKTKQRLAKWEESQLKPQPKEPKKQEKIKVEIKPKQKSVPVIVPKKLTMKDYQEFVKDCFPKAIPPRPISDEIVCDAISKRFLNQQQWDELYGKWRPFIEKKVKK